MRLSATMKAAFSRHPTILGKVYQPQWDVREEKSLYADIPSNGDTLGYHLIKDLQLPMDWSANKFVIPNVWACHLAVSI